MGKLKPREERLAHYLADGLKLVEALEKIGLKRINGSISGGGYTIANKPEVQARVDEIVEERASVTRRATEIACKNLSITVERVLVELANIGFANMGDYYDLTDGGRPFIDFSKLTPAQTAAIAEITIDEFSEKTGDEAEPTRKIRRTKFKLHDKKAALVDIGKHLGMFSDKMHLSMDQTLTDLVLASMRPKDRSE